MAVFGRAGLGVLYFAIIFFFVPFSHLSFFVRRVGWDGLGGGKD
jgi:hypothetical protein